MKWFFEDKNGKVVIGQFPNPPMVVFFSFLVASKIFQQGQIHQLLRLGFGLSLMYWCYLEIFHGDSPWRRCLGLAVSTIAIKVILQAILA